MTNQELEVFSSLLKKYKEREHYCRNVMSQNSFDAGAKIYIQHDAQLSAVLRFIEEIIDLQHNLTTAAKEEAEREAMEIKEFLAVPTIAELWKYFQNQTKIKAQTNAGNHKLWQESKSKNDTQ